MAQESIHNNSIINIYEEGQFGKVENDYVELGSCLPQSKKPLGKYNILDLSSIYYS